MTTNAEKFYSTKSIVTQSGPPLLTLEKSALRIFTAQSSFILDNPDEIPLLELVSCCGPDALFSVIGPEVCALVVQDTSAW